MKKLSTLVLLGMAFLLFSASTSEAAGLAKVLGVKNLSGDADNNDGGVVDDNIIFQTQGGQTGGNVLDEPTFHGCGVPVFSPCGGTNISIDITIIIDLCCSVCCPQASACRCSGF